MHEIIYHDRIKTVLEQEFVRIHENLQIISAYCTRNALEYVDAKIPTSPIAKKLMVRFRLDDVLSGATDFDIYEYCKRHSWSLFVQFNLHAKTFVFDQNRLIIGSANLTSKGIGLVNDCNLEMAVLASVDVDELQKINAMFDTATQMTDGLYELMKKQIAATRSNGNDNAEWNSSIYNLINDRIITLFAQDFPKSESPDNILPDDAFLLQLPRGTIDKAVIKASFISTNGFKWLVQTLKAAENNQLYFGAITARLHDALVNDPQPYRKEVKVLLANLLSWITELEIECLKVERPNYSQLVKLIN